MIINKEDISGLDLHYDNEVLGTLPIGVYSGIKMLVDLQVFGTVDDIDLNLVMPGYEFIVLDQYQFGVCTTSDDTENRIYTLHGTLCDESIQRLKSYLIGNSE